MKRLLPLLLVSIVTACGNSSPLESLKTETTGNKDLPLLGSMRGGHYWFDYCAGQPDDAVVPQDPRELVVPGVNQGKAVYFNAWWQTCQDDNHPGTCGELKARAARGYPLVASAGEVGAGSFFSGNYAESNFAFTAEDYAGMWQSIWGLAARPDHYD